MEIIDPMNTQLKNGTLASLTFDNRFTRELPADPETTNRRRQVTEACYSRVYPTRVAAPRLVAYSQEAAALLDLSAEACKSGEFTQVFSGNDLLAGMDPYATCYGGHQFGNWAGQLGDGRAINLGEIINQRSERWALQLKGAGPTPYARSADGLAVLRSSVREFLCSEAMFHLGVPTTRALSLIATSEPVERDMFYDGHSKEEPGAVVCRRTADLIVQWMRVGFVHGVMNTDNMSILGLTLDYGPYGWVDNYDPNWTPNTTDAAGRRYRFGHQPQIAHWNLAQLANAIYPLIKAVLPGYIRRIVSRYQ